MMRNATGYYDVLCSTAVTVSSDDGVPSRPQSRADGRASAPTTLRVTYRTTAVHTAVRVL